MTDESKDAAGDVPIVVETVWDVVDRFTQDDGRSGWTCPGCKNKFFGLNATKAKAHILRLGGFSVLPCHSWHDINQKKLELLAEIHYKKEKESDAKKQKKEQDAAGIEAANTSATGLATCFLRALGVLRGRSDRREAALLLGCRTPRRLPLRFHRRRLQP